MNLQIHHVAACAVVLVACVVAPTQQYSTGSSSAQPAPPVGNWQEVRVANDSLRVLMPWQPTIEESSESDFDGTDIHSTIGRLQTGQMLIGFMVLSAQGGFISDPFERARSAATTDSSASNWKIRWEKKSEADGFQTADRIVDNEEAGASIRFHYVEGKTKIYTLFALYPTIQEQTSTQWIETYMEGAKYSPNEALVRVGDGTLDTTAWQSINPPGRDFAGEIPGLPFRATNSERLTNIEAETHIYGVGDADQNFGFQILVHEFEDKIPKDALETARKVTARDFASSAEIYVHQRGYPGLDVTLTSATHTLRAQYFVTSQRIYELVSWSPTANVADHKDAHSRFVGSFRIL